jgi:hypothetical protein
MHQCPETDAGNCAGHAEATLAKVLAPEDVRVGDYVALLHVVCEMPSFWWRDGINATRPEVPVRIPLMVENGGVPLEVRSVCLPFVLVKSPAGELRNLDVRRHGLARLDPRHAMTAWKACKKSQPERRRV